MQIKIAYTIDSENLDEEIHERLSKVQRELQQLSEMLLPLANNPLKLLSIAERLSTAKEQIQDMSYIRLEMDSFNKQDTGNKDVQETD